MAALVVLAAKAAPVGPGDTIESVVLVRNLGAEADVFEVLVHGDAAPWARVDPPIVSLGPGAEQPVWVRFDVPSDRDLAGRTFDFAVTVTSRADPSFIHAERGEVAVRPPAVPEPLAAATWPAAGALHDRDAEGEDGEDAEDGEDDDRSLARALTRSAVVLGAILLAGFVAVAAIGSQPEQQAGTATSDAAPLPSTAVEAPAAEEGADPAGDASVVPAPEQPVQRGSAAGVAPAAAPADLPALVFVRWYGPGDRDLVVRDPGTEGRELRLRSPGSVESSPVLSPDGADVAFVRERGGQWQLCVVSRVGGETQCLVPLSAGSMTAWRPDGGALFATRGSELIEVVLGAGRRSVADVVVRPVTVPSGGFSLSPDGTRIAFVDQRRIVIRPIAGGDGLSLRVPGAPEATAWAPGGDRILYTADTQVFSAPLGSGAIRQLTSDGTVNGDPVAAGSWVVFRSNRSGNGDLYAVRHDGADKAETGLAQVTRASERDTDPST